MAYPTWGVPNYMGHDDDDDVPERPPTPPGYLRSSPIPRPPTPEGYGKPSRNAALVQNRREAEESETSSSEDSESDEVPAPPKKAKKAKVVKASKKSKNAKRHAKGIDNEAVVSASAASIVPPPPPAGSRRSDGKIVGRSHFSQSSELRDGGVQYEQSSGYCMLGEDGHNTNTTSHFEGNQS